MQSFLSNEIGPGEHEKSKACAFGFQTDVEMKVVSRCLSPELSLVLGARLDIVFGICSYLFIVEFQSRQILTRFAEFAFFHTFADILLQSLVYGLGKIVCRSLPSERNCDSLGQQ
jgi:hypothetical protein